MMVIGTTKYSGDLHIYDRGRGYRIRASRRTRLTRVRRKLIHYNAFIITIIVIICVIIILLYITSYRDAAASDDVPRVII